MKVQASVKRMCKNCEVRIRNGRRVITCIHPKHKQRQG